jgi:hypothetical protein
MNVCLRQLLLDLCDRGCGDDCGSCGRRGSSLYDLDNLDES